MFSAINPDVSNGPGHCAIGANGGHATWIRVAGIDRDMLGNANRYNPVAAFGIKIGMLGTVCPSGWSNAVHQRIAGRIIWRAWRTERPRSSNINGFTAMCWRGLGGTTKRHVEYFWRSPRKHATLRIDAPCDFVFQRITFAAIFAPQVNHEREEKQHECQKHQFGHIDCAHYFYIINHTSSSHFPLHVGNSVNSYRSLVFLLCRCRPITGPSTTNVTSNNRISTAYTAP